MTINYIKWLDFISSDLFTLCIIVLGFLGAALLSWATPEATDGEIDRYEHRRRVEAHHGR